MDLVDSLGSPSDFATQEGWATPTRFNLNNFRGDAGFNVTNVFNVSYVYEIPAKSQNRWANAVIAHWSFSGIVSGDSGLPDVVYLTADNENIGSVGRLNEFPDLVGNPNSISKRTINEWFNTAAYVVPPFGTMGNAGKHTLYSDPEINWNSSTSKRWPFGEGKDVEFRAEFFDFLNSSTFDPAGSLMGTPQFGTIFGTRQGGRTIQFALKLRF